MNLAHGQHPTRHWRSHDIKSHTDVIVRQVRISVLDPRIQQLEQAILAGYTTFDLYDNLVWAEGRGWVEGGSGRVRRLVLPGGGPVTDEREVIDRNFKVVKRNVEYISDEEVRSRLIRMGVIPNDPKTAQHDFFLTVGAMLFFGWEDCDGHVTAHSTLNTLAGFKVGLEVIATNTKEWEHVFGLVGVPRQRPTMWLPLDTAAPNVNARPYPGWQVSDCQPGVPFDGRCATNRWRREIKL